MSGRLCIISTPIGNLADLSARARETLAAVDRVLCEDTRRAGKLLSALGLKKPLVSLHEHNEEQRLPQLEQALERGETLGLISDAGTPLVSDPGFLLVRRALEAGHAVEPIPGPSALLAALVVSGLPPYPFTFAGFPPPKAGRRRSFYRRFRELQHTLVFYESPHRIHRSLVDAELELGNRPAALARELTKVYEEVLRAPLSELVLAVRERPRIKGELVLVVEGHNQRNRSLEAPES